MKFIQIYALIFGLLFSACTVTDASYVNQPRPRSSASPVPAGNVGYTASSGAFTDSSGSVVSVTNLSRVMKTTGRPMYIGLYADGNATTNPVDASSLTCTKAATTSIGCTYYIYRDSTVISKHNMQFLGASGDLILSVPSSSLSTIDFPSSGTHVYSIRAQSVNNTVTVGVQNAIMMAYEL